MIDKIMDVRFSWKWICFYGLFVCRNTKCPVYNLFNQRECLDFTNVRSLNYNFV